MLKRFATRLEERNLVKKKNHSSFQLKTYATNFNSFHFPSRAIALERKIPLRMRSIRINDAMGREEYHRTYILKNFSFLRLAELCSPLVFRRVQHKLRKTFVCDFFAAHTRCLVIIKRREKTRLHFCIKFQAVEFHIGKRQLKCNSV